MSSIKDRIAAFNKSSSVEVQPSQTVVTPARRSSLTTSNNNNNNIPSSSSSTTTTTTTTLPEDKSKVDTIGSGERKLSVKERASMIKTSQPEQSQSNKNITTHTISDNTNNTTTESKVQIETSTGLSVKERLAQMKSSTSSSSITTSSTTTEPAVPVRRSSIKDIYPPSKTPENTPDTKSSSSSSTLKSTPPPAFRLPSNPSPKETVPITVSSSSSSSSTMTTTSSEAVNDTKPMSSVQEKVSQMKINQPLGRRSTTNDINTKSTADSSSSSSNTTSSGSTSTPAAITPGKRQTTLNTSFLNKPAEKETTPSGPQTGPAKRVSKLNPALFGNVNINAFVPGGAPPPFAMPPSSGRLRSDTAPSKSGEMVHVSLIYSY